MTKEEIFDKYSNVDKDEKGRLIGADFMDSNDFYKAADEYAGHQVVAFQKWTNLNGWFWAPNRWMNYHGDPNPQTTEELYNLFINNPSK